MTDLATTDYATADDLATLIGLLIGGPLTASYRDPGLRSIANYGPGWLRRVIQQTPGDPIGPRQQLTLLAAATALTVPGLAQSAVLTPETQGIRYTTDGTVPTATVGTPIAAGQSVLFGGQATLTGLQVFRQAAGAILHVDYYT